MRTPLFDFVVARNPQTIQPADDEIFAIRLSTALQALTHYLSDLPRLSFQRIRVALEDRRIAFGEVRSLRGLRSEYSAHITLIREAHRERYRETFAQFSPILTDLNLAPLSDTDRVLLWDNLVHHLWLDQNEDCVEVIRSILVADHLRSVAVVIFRDSEPLSAEDEQALRRAMRARVVMPVGVDNRVQTATLPPLSAVQQSLLRAAHIRIRDQGRIRTITALRAEISQAANAQRRISAGAAEPVDPTTPGRVLGNPGGFAAVRPASSVLRPRQAFSISDLAIAMPTALPARLSQIAAPERDADFAILELSDELEVLALDLEDQDEAEPENEQVFFLHGAEITVAERVPEAAFMISAEETATGRDLILTYYHGGSGEELDQISGQITTPAGTVAITATEIETDIVGYQHFQLTTSPFEGSRFNVTLQARAIDASRSAELPALVVRSAGEASGIIPWSGPNDLVANPPPLFGVNKVGVLDFHRVEQELYCFEASEPSHIENLMGREHKERMTRSFTLTEVETQTSSENSFERQADQQTTDRAEMQKTVQEVMQQDSSRNINVNAGVSGGFGNSVQMFANTAITFANSTSREESRSEALTYAQEITSRVAEKIVSKSTSSRRTLQQHEFEDVSRRGLDNREGAEAVVSIYRWLDKVYQNKLVNYGRRCVVEWMIPDPGRGFIDAQKAAVPEDDFTKRPPKRPRRIGLRGAASVTRRNYRRFAKAYGVEDLPPPPAKFIHLSKSYAENSAPVPPPEEEDDDGPVSPSAQAFAYEIELPEDYVAVQIDTEHDDPDTSIPDGAEGGGGGNFNSLDPGLSFTVPYADIRKFPTVTTINVTCKLRAAVFNDWQYQVYTQLIAAYREQKAVYDRAKEDYEAENRRAELNPRFKKDIIQRELRRIALYMIQKPHMTDVTHDHYTPGPDGGLPVLNLTAKLDQHAALARFFEQAFDFDLMAYLLYPYYYGEQKTWSARLAMEETRNRDFAAFLSSGMARLVVPIRPGFEDAVTHYLQTGEVWFGRGIVMDVDNDLYLSIAEEMASGNETVEVEDTWLTKVPTNLTIIQEDAGAIIGDGLPCKEEDDPLGVGPSSLAPVLPITSTG